MKNFAQLLYLKLLILTVVGCSSLLSKPTPTTNLNCVCVDYFSGSPRPEWVDAGDIVNVNIYQATGNSQCTGLKNIDLEKSGLSARTNLSRIINTQVKSSIEINEITDSGMTSSRTSINSFMHSEGYLENSQITHKWVDPVSCTVYSRAQISTADVESNKTRIANKEASRLKNKLFYLDFSDNSDEHIDLISASAGSLISELGVKRLASDTKTTAYHLSFTFIPTNIVEGRSIRGSLLAKIIDPDKSTIWQKTIPAKGVSYSYATNRVLKEKAISSAMRSMKPHIKTILYE